MSQPSFENFLEDSEHRADVFAFLELIRQTGKINMAGASPYIAEQYGYSKNDARKILMEWIQFNSKVNNLKNKLTGGKHA